MAKAIAFFTAWSISRYKDWLKCPRFAHWAHILKKQRSPKSPALQRGADVHKEGERYFQIEPIEFGKLKKPMQKLYEKVGFVRRLKKLPDAYKLFRKEMEELRKAGASSEGQRAMDSAWRQSDWFDAARTWCRVVYDAKLWLPKLRRVRVIDFKTGKIYPDDNDEQMELYAVTGFSEHPDADEVVTELWYLDQPRKADPKKPDEANPRVRTFTRSQVARLQKKWEQKVAPMMKDRRFPPSPGRQCAWCDFSHRKGGDCEF